MKFRLSGTLLRFVDYHQEIVVEDAGTVESALRSLVTRYPALKNVLYDADSNVRMAHRLFLNGELPGSDQTAEPLSDDDDLEILTAIAGG